ncbi:MAG: transcriptional repressor LexA [Myxococcales bacterium]|nr:transcriptional repressor LexA [Myxococcales bacterium]
MATNATTSESKRKKLTKRQQMVYDFIVDTIKEHGYPPTLREIGNHLDISSTNGVNDHLKALEKKGFLRKGSLRARALTPLANGEELNLSSSGAIRVPVLGTVAAGVPIPRVEEAKETLIVDPNLLGTTSPDDVFALEVQGRSMINDAILEGDYILVRQQKDAKNGEIVVAVVEDEVTVKRFYRENGKIRLQPANDTMSPIQVSELDQKDLSIVGVAIGLSRKF